jgi:hypothetical protein
MIAPQPPGRSASPQGKISVNIFAKLRLHLDTAAHHRRVLAVLTYLRSQRTEA